MTTEELEQLLSALDWNEAEFAVELMLADSRKTQIQKRLDHFLSVIHLGLTWKDLEVSISKYERIRKRFCKGGRKKEKQTLSSQKVGWAG